MASSSEIALMALDRTDIVLLPLDGLVDSHTRKSTNVALVTAGIDTVGQLRAMSDEDFVVAGIDNTARDAFRSGVARLFELSGVSEIIGEPSVPPPCYDTATDAVAVEGTNNTSNLTVATNDLAPSAPPISPAVNVMFPRTDAFTERPALDGGQGPPMYAPMLTGGTRVDGLSDTVTAPRGDFKCAVDVLGGIGVITLKQLVDMPRDLVLELLETTGVPPATYDAIVDAIPPHIKDGTACMERVENGDGGLNTSNANNTSTSSLSLVAPEPSLPDGVDASTVDNIVNYSGVRRAVAIEAARRFVLQEQQVNWALDNAEYDPATAPPELSLWPCESCAWCNRVTRPVCEKCSAARPQRWTDLNNPELTDLDREILRQQEQTNSTVRAMHDIEAASAEKDAEIRRMAEELSRLKIASEQQDEEMARILAEKQAEEARVALSATKLVSFELTVPDEWDPQQSGCELKYVLPGSGEYASLVALIRETSQREVLQIERVQNAALWRAYSVEKLRIAEKNGYEPREMLLFHGTRTVTPATIYDGEQGFDFRHSANGMWGAGSYFAEKASYSLGYAHNTNVPGVGDVSQMFIAKVLVGEHVDLPSNNSLRFPPFKPGSTTERYDSVAGVTQNCTVHIVYSHAASYPAYLVSFARS